MARLRKILFVVYILGVFLFSVLVHETIHVFQRPVEKWEMCFTNDIKGYGTYAFVRQSMKDDNVLYVTEEYLQKQEILPNIIQIIISILGVLYFYKNITAFDKDIS